MRRTLIEVKSEPGKFRRTTSRTNTEASATTTKTPSCPRRCPRSIQTDLRPLEWSPKTRNTVKQYPYSVTTEKEKQRTRGLAEGRDSICRSRHSIALDFRDRGTLFAAFDLDSALEEGAVLDTDAGRNYVTGHRAVFLDLHAVAGAHVSVDFAVN